MCVTHNVLRTKKESNVRGLINLVAIWQILTRNLHQLSLKTTRRNVRRNNLNFWLQQFRLCGGGRQRFPNKLQETSSGVCIFSFPEVWRKKNMPFWVFGQKNYRKHDMKKPLQENMMSRKYKKRSVKRNKWRANPDASAAVSLKTNGGLTAKAGGSLDCLWVFLPFGYQRE